VPCNNFPFSCFEDPIIFQDTINNPINHIPDILQLQDMVYDPFQTNDDDGRGVLGDIDPDLNFLHDIRGSLIQNCNYYYNTSLYDQTKAKADEVDISLCHLNIRSLPRNLNSFLTTLQSSAMEFNVLAFTETWLKPSNVDAYGIKGYTHEHIIRETKIGGGTSLFVKDTWDYKLRSDLNIINDDMEMIWIEVDKDSLISNNNTIIGAIYRRPGSDPNIFT
jgi:hypothetical protein